MPDLDLSIQNDQKRTIDLKGLDEIAHLVWNAESEKAGQITLVLTDDNQLTKINKQFLNKDYNTDVIAFPLSDAMDDLFEGEVYISVERVIENASHYKAAPSHELKRIVVHALLHFLGYSDKEMVGKKKMTKRENFYLEQFTNFNVRLSRAKDCPGQ